MIGELLWQKRNNSLLLEENNQLQGVTVSLLRKRCAIKVNFRVCVCV